MSQRTTSVVLKAEVQNYLSNMAAAEKRTLEVEKAARSATEQFSKHNEALTKIGAGFVAVGATAAAGVALVVRAAAEYGAKMAQLQSLSHASQADMKLLSDAAMSVGQAYGFSASQVADAEIELTKAGVSVQAQLGGALKGALTLAAAGQIEVGQATEYATVAMTQFGLKASDVPHLADLMAAGADKALGSVGDLGEALKNGGLQAHNMGLTLDDTVGLLSAFANSGILGAEAGTQMRSMFIQLQKPTKQARDVLDEYGISLSDSKGRFVGITALAGELHDKLGGLTQAQRNAALATVFGSHAITGATVLYQDGAKGIATWIRSVNDSGFASAQAAGKMNSLTGDAQKLAAAWQTDLIQAGGGLDGMLRLVTEDATGIVKAFGGIPTPIQSVVVVAGVATAGVGLLGGAFLLAVPKVAALKLAMEELKVSGVGLAGLFGKGTLLIAGLAAVTSGFAAMGEQGTATAQQVEQAGLAIQNSWSGMDKLFGSAGNALDAGSGLKSSLDELSNGDAAWTKWLDGATAHLTHFADVYKGNEGTFDAMGQQLAGLAKQNYSAAASSFSTLASKYHLTAGEQRTLLQQMPAYRDALTVLAGKAHVAATDVNLVAIAQGKGAVSAKVLAAAQAEAASAAVQQQTGLNRLAGSAVSAKVDIDKLEKTIEGFGSAQLDARSATRAFYQAVDDADAAVRKNGRSLDVHTQKGRDNQAALDGIASSADAAAGKILKETGSQDKAAAAMAKGRAEYIRVAEAMGLSRAAATRLANQLNLIPGNVRTAVHLTGADSALTMVGDITTRLKGLDGRSATVTVHYRSDGSVSQTIGTGANRRSLFAAGGDVTGTGPKGVDSVPAVLAPGEHVWTAREVDAAGGQDAMYRLRAATLAGTLPAYATGGGIGDANRFAHNASMRSDLLERGLDESQRRLKAQERTVSSLQDAYDGIDGTKAHRAAKRAAKDRLDAAKKQAESIQKRIDSQQKALDAAKSDEDRYQASGRQLGLDREDFVSAERRDPTRRSSDPLAYVDQLRQMSRDDNFTAKRRKDFDAAANRYEASLVKLAASSEKATQKLDDLKQSSAQLHDQVQSAVAGGYSTSSASSAVQASGWVTRGGMRFQSYTTGPTAAGIASYYTQGAASAKRFSDDLARLARRGLAPELISQIAGYGVEQGQPILTALLSATAAQITQINRGQKSINAAAAAAGSTAADDTYAGQIKAAKANADAIQKTITTDGEKLRKLIAAAFGLKGYAAGTDQATPGVHLVGEHGPELVGFRGGEKVLNAQNTARWVRGSDTGGGGGGGPIQIEVRMPSTMNLIDADGQVIGRVRTEARGVATQVVNARHDQIAVRLMGAAV